MTGLGGGGFGFTGMTGSSGGSSGTAGAIGSIGSAIAGIVGAGLNYAAAKENTALEKAMLRYQKNLQNEIFQREDTAIQRRKLDLLAAGLSPVLAAGQGAGTGGVVSTVTPQVQSFDISSLAKDALAGMTQGALIGKTVAEQKAVELQQKKLTEETRVQKAIADQKEFDLAIQRESGVPSGSSIFGKVINDATGIKLNVEKRLKDMYDYFQK